MTIWKWILQATDVQEVEMPEDAISLTVMEQAGQVCLWAKCSPDAPKRWRRFRILGTGHSAQEDSDVYVGSCQLGQLVFHVFEMTQTA